MAEFEQHSAVPEQGAQDSVAPVVADGAPVSASGIAPLPFSADDYRREIKRVKRSRRRKVLLCVLLALLVAGAVFVVAVLKVPGSFHVVHGDAMKSILSDGQVVLAQKVSAPAEKDVVVYRSSDGSEQVGRVVAIAGGWVNLASDGTIVISSMMLEGNSAAGLINGDAVIVDSRQVPAGYCFIVGDNAGGMQGSLDSSANFVAKSNILGKVTYKVWPIVNMSAVH